MNYLLVGEGMVKSFGIGEEKRRVLDGVSVNINEGEFVSVMGPSGCGKSTLLYALSGMDAIDEGRVVFEGKELSGLSDNDLSDLRRQRMGFVFQQPTLLKNLNILDNILLTSMRDNRKDAVHLGKRAKMLMKEIGIEDLEQRSITQVSGGQLQRAGICRALMNSPKIIFGDEPTGALNSKSAKEVMELFHWINKAGTAVVLVTHDAGVAARTNRVLFMGDGQITGELKLSEYEEKAHRKRVERIMGRMQEAGI